MANKKQKPIIINDVPYEIVARYKTPANAVKAIKRLGPPHKYTPNPYWTGRRSARFLVVKPAFAETLFDL